MLSGPNTRQAELQRRIHNFTPPDMRESREIAILVDQQIEVERYSIEANYYLSATGELEEAAQTYELFKQTDPRDFLPHSNLGFIYAALGKYEKQWEENREALCLEPNVAVNFLNVGKAFTKPLDTLVQRNWLPSIRAAVALERKNPNRAIERLK